jgi:AraC family transcriptional regulator
MNGMLAVVGLFPSGIPQERPAACAIVPPSSITAFGNLTDGEYCPLAMSFAPATTVVEALVHENPELCFVGDSTTPVRIRNGEAVSPTPFRVQLRPRRPIDPPLVLVLPLLLAAEMIGAVKFSGPTGPDREPWPSGLASDASTTA